MWLLTYKNYSILCWGWLHMWTKFVADWSKIATCITQNVTISFKDEYRRHTDVTLWRNWWKSFWWMIYILSFYTWCQIEVILKIAIFFKLTKIWGTVELFRHNCVTGSLVCYLDSQSNLLHFELLIDVLAQKLTELWQFQNLTYFLTSWPS